MGELGMPGAVEGAGHINGGQTMREDHESQPCSHPGPYIKRHFMKQLGIKIGYISYRTGLAPDMIEALLAGQRDIDKDLRNKLKPVFGVKGATVLYNMQKNYNSYVQRETRRTKRPS
jgi:plasmid maintenance system antidote protein VapI